MRTIDELIPDVAISVPGAPQISIIHAISRATAEFLSRSEAWREWSYDVDPLDVVSGVYEWEKHIDPTAVDIDDYKWVRVKRVDLIEWGAEGYVTYRTASWLSERNREWRSTTGTPVYFTNEGNGGGAVRFAPVPNATSYDYTIKARLVMITQVTNGLPGSVPNALNSQLAQLPDRLFERYREVIVAGALAILQNIPGRDWTDKGTGAYNRALFENGIIAAASAAAVDYGHPNQTIEYGGL